MGPSKTSNNSLDVYKRVLHFLQQPESYPDEQANHVEHLQTHISHVFIVPPFVYKIKKPVSLDFLDFNTLEKRKFYCEREVELNRRLCADIYLGSIPIYKHGHSFTFESGSENSDTAIAEYAVKMKQLSAQHFLHKIIEDSRLTEEQLDRIADKLTRFYQDQSPTKEILEWGHIENIKINTDENFQQTSSFIGKTIHNEAFELIQDFTNRYLNRNAELFDKRRQEHRIVDGHGDLHVEHIHITADNICVYDCIEFNDRFRYLDPASDLAFLAMDLDNNGLRTLSNYFIKQMAHKLDDDQLLRIIDFYKCYRAYVRGKVESMTSQDGEVDEKKRTLAAKKAQHYFNLSLNYALLGSKPVVLIFMGPVASGKTTLAKLVAKQLNPEYYASDVIRKKMGDIPLRHRTSEHDRKKLYTDEISEKTYSGLYEQTKESVRQNKNVILDATFSRARDRTRLAGLIDSENGTYYFIETYTTTDTLKKRLKHREGETLISDARLEDFEMLMERYEPPDEVAPSHLIRVNTSQDQEQTLHKLFNKLLEIHLQKI